MCVGMVCVWTNKLINSVNNLTAARLSPQDLHIVYPKERFTCHSFILCCASSPLIPSYYTWFLILQHLFQLFYHVCNLIVEFPICT